MQSGLCCQLFDGVVSWQYLVIEGSPCRGGGGSPVGGGPQSQCVEVAGVEKASRLNATASSVSQHTLEITSGGSDAHC